MGAPLPLLFSSSPALCFLLPCVTAWPCRVCSVVRAVCRPWPLPLVEPAPEEVYPGRGKRARRAAAVAAGQRISVTARQDAEREAAGGADLAGDEVTPTPPTADGSCRDAAVLLPVAGKQERLHSVAPSVPGVSARQAPEDLGENPCPSTSGTSSASLPG
jgi:hypothetical protein